MQVLSSNSHEPMKLQFMQYISTMLKWLPAARRQHVVSRGSCHLKSRRGIPSLASHDGSIQRSNLALYASPYTSL